jgi:hypothetical protein
MKNISLMLLLCTITTFSFAQSANNIINTTEVERIERTLSADDMQGRKIGTAGIEKAANFIAEEFKVARLEGLDGLKDYKQTFVMLRPKQIAVSAKTGQQTLDEKSIVVVTSQPTLKVTQASGFEKATIKAGANFFAAAQKYALAIKNYIVFVDTSFSKNFSRLSFLKRQIYKSNTSVVFILTATEPSEFEINAQHEFSEVSLANVVGVIPGKSRKNEYVVFSGHYDHLGIGKAVNNDSIYNGANDDAAGTTSVIMLAKYYKALKSNERTLVFVAFTAEESGGYGSQYFSRQMDAAKVVAMFNIEMIGTESKWGKGSAYITGYEKTDMGKILEKNLEGSTFKFYPDPYPDQNLFYRSDNATLARLGVPAHTISTSKMDSEPNYHKQSDEIGTLDMNNMTEIIKAIAISAKSIVNGKDAPTRVNSDDLK